MHLKLKGPSGVDSVLSGSCPSFLKPPALLAVGVGPRHMQLDPDALSVLRDVQHIRGCVSNVWCMAYAPSGMHLAMGYASGIVKLLDSDSLSVLREVQLIRGRAMYMAYARPCQAWSSGGKLRMSEATQDVKDIMTDCTGQVPNAVEQIQKKQEEVNSKLDHRAC